jgi:hypothetical protein
VLITTIVPSLPSIRRVTPRIAVLGSVYFVLIGLGFMFVEIGLIQRISIYLGHPVYGMAIGLFGIIVSTGLGSLCSYRLSLLNGLRLQLWAGALGLYLILLPYWFPLLIGQFAAGSLLVRAAVSLTANRPFRRADGFRIPHRNGNRKCHRFASDTLVLGGQRCGWRSWGRNRRTCQHPRHNKHDIVVRSCLLSAARADCDHPSATPPS